MTNLVTKESINTVMGKKSSVGRQEKAEAEMLEIEWAVV